MSEATFHFHGRLNDFLKRDQRDKAIVIAFRGQQSIKHLAESLGAPHPEIGRVQVNGREGSVNDITQDGDRVELHPIADGCPIEPRFLLDCHLGRLASLLRMLGFDCLYQNDYDDAQIAEIAGQEERILLTRDRRLLMRKVIRHGYCLRSLDSLEQLTEVLERFKLSGATQPFHRCIRCNHPLEPVEKEAIIERLEPLTRLYFDEFHICPACGQIYWKGSHYEKMLKLVERFNGLS
ncbi:MAG: twitching motility protein PilT [Anaerolineales bacterium]|nr:twitching motility protein PilT [Anaerolineae bacterium]PWB71320.1 MAG: twitching motility protein PilT [Anaerolineales bacterium]